MRNKYGNRKTVVDGLVFASRAESRRYEELKLLEYAGEISELRIQPEYILQEGFTHKGRKIRPIIYRADFAYVENGVECVEDTKGFRTQVFEVKRKLFLFRFPTVDFRIV